MNGVIAGLLRDLAAVQTSRERTWGYKRAAAAVAALDIPIDHLIQPDGAVARIANIGPASTRVILEVLATGASSTVEEAVAASPKRADVERSRRLRDGFLSRAQVARTLRDPSLYGPARKQYRGDLQMHSVWSDGSQTLEDICHAGRARGYDYAAVTDHSHGLPIAGGVPMARVEEQHREIDQLNAASDGTFRLLKGIECNIRADGSLDLSAEELARFEIVVAAPHAVLRSSSDQTARMVAAVSTPGVHILGHPRGRMYGSRPGVSADWGAVFAARRAIGRGRRAGRRSGQAGPGLPARAPGGSCRLSVRARQRCPRGGSMVVRRDGAGPCTPGRHPAFPRDQHLAARPPAGVGA